MAIEAHMRIAARTARGLPLLTPIHEGVRDTASLRTGNIIPTLQVSYAA